MIKKIYVYLVLFSTLMMTIGGSVSVFTSLADLVSPSPYVLSYGDYVQSYYTEYDQRGTVKKAPSLGDEQYRDAYNEYVKQEEAVEQKRSLNRFIASFGWIIVPFPVFLFMQRKLRENTTEPADNPKAD